MVTHSHEGSIGNLSLDEIREKLDMAKAKFNFKAINQALDVLLNSSK
jgi:argininosuccinate lyase